MSIVIGPACLQCHLRRNLELAQSLGTQAQAMAFARDLMRMYLDAPEGISSPWFNPQVAQLLHKHYGLPLDRYQQERADSNRFVLERMEQLQQKARSAADPVLAGLQLAILGNYLDFSALQGQVNFDTLDTMLEQALQMQLDSQVYQQLRRDLAGGRKLLYLTDNAGEIGFDRIFAQEIARAWPQLEITFCVRGGNTLNDATREDAAAVGIPFPVIDNGNLVPGTQLDLLGAEARQALEQADVVIAKGMANVETMYGCGYPVYYAFLVKCQHFVDIFQQPLLTPLLVREGTPLPKQA